MLSNPTKARLGAKGTAAIARRPMARRAALKAGLPAARVLAKRKARGQLQPIGATARKAGSLVVVYGPLAAEALGLLEPPKPKRRAPAFAAVAALALATVSLVLLRRRG